MHESKQLFAIFGGAAASEPKNEKAKRKSKKERYERWHRTINNRMKNGILYKLILIMLQ